LRIIEVLLATETIINLFQTHWKSVEEENHWPKGDHFKN